MKITKKRKKKKKQTHTHTQTNGRVRVRVRVRLRERIGREKVAVVSLQNDGLEPPTVKAILSTNNATKASAQAGKLTSLPGLKLVEYRSRSPFPRCEPYETPSRPLTGPESSSFGGIV